MPGRRNPRARWVLPEVIDPPERLCFQIEVPNDIHHIAAFKGALYTLTSAISWGDDINHTAKDVAAVWSEIYDNIRACTDTPIETENDCIDYLPNSENITFAPQDPFSQPGLIPDGYVQPPFFVLGEPNLIEQLLGLKKGDVLTGFFGFPVLTPALGQGLARFRVHVRGTGVVELHFLKIPLGGMVLITEDDNILSANIVSLYKDPVSLPLELITEIVVEIEFKEPGNHHIDVSFLARFNDELTFFTYGGGLRSVVLCGFDNMGIDTSIEIEDEGMKLRINPDDPCIIQNECSPGVWENWYDPRQCITGGASQQPPGGDISVGDCREYDIVLQGNGKYILPVALNDGYKIIVTLASGGWNDGGVTWHCPNGFTYLLGGCANATPAQAGDPLQSVNHMRLVAEYDGNFVDAFNSTITIVPGTGATNLTFQANDSDISNNSGSVSFHVQVCNPATETFVHVFDFTTDDHDWTAVVTGGVPLGEHVPGLGWRSVQYNPDPQGALIVERAFSQRAITRYVVEYYRQNDTLASGNTHSFFSLIGAVVQEDHVMPIDAGNHVEDWTTSVSADIIHFNHRIGVATPQGVVLSKVTVYGTGSDPF